VAAASLADVQERPGEGVFGTFAGRAVALKRPEGSATTAVLLQTGEGPDRLIPITDALRPDAREAIAALEAQGIECSILSGDSEKAVAEVARQADLPAKAGVRPEEKQAMVAQLRGSGRKVLMVGDGLNDGPALAAADASIAPGSASDVGLQAADFVFVQDSLSALPRTVRAARKTMQVVKQNFGLAIVYNMFAVPLAIAGLVTPLIAAIAMSASSLLVVANSLRLARAAR